MTHPKITRICVAATLALLGALLATAPPASADEENKDRVTVGVRTATAQGGDERGHYFLAAPPSGVIVDYLAVMNYSTRAVDVRLLPRDASSTTDSSFTVQASGEKATDVGSWITMDKETLRLKPRSQTIVPFELNVPAGATPGDHVGAIVVSLLARQPDAQGGGVLVDHRVGVRMYLRVPGKLEPKLEVSDLTATWDGAWSPTGRGTTTVSYVVRNTGNVRLGAEQQLALTRSLGLGRITREQADIEEILPGGSIAVRAEVDGVLSLGDLDAEVRLTPVPVTDDVDVERLPSTTTRAEATAWPWLLIIEVLALLLIVTAGGFDVRRRRRRRRAPSRRRPRPNPPSQPRRAPRCLPCSAPPPSSRPGPCSAGWPGSRPPRPTPTIPSGGAPTPPRRRAPRTSRSS